MPKVHDVYNNINQYNLINQVIIDFECTL